MSIRGLGRTILEPARLPRELYARWPWATFETRLKWDALDRPAYAYGTYHAARQARRLGLPGITVIELGVAGGRGLVALERHARSIQSLVGIEVQVLGFDLGTGMPPPRDYRDMPYVWKPGYFSMSGRRLGHELRSAEVLLGDVSDSVPAFLARPPSLPIGFVAFDLDYYSSTVHAFALLAADEHLVLPRVFCYFDDVVGDDDELHSEYAGELLAIREFNLNQAQRKLAPIHGLAYKRRLRAEWHVKMFVLHCFSHRLYEKHVGRSDWQIPLD